jgi:hypothetical protein
MPQIVAVNNAITAVAIAVTAGEIASRNFASCTRVGIRPNAHASKRTTAKISIKTAIGRNVLRINTPNRRSENARTLPIVIAEQSAATIPIAAPVPYPPISRASSRSLAYQGAADAASQAREGLPLRTLAFLPRLRWNDLVESPFRLGRVAWRYAPRIRQCVGRSRLSACVQVLSPPIHHAPVCR